MSSYYVTATRKNPTGAIVALKVHLIEKTWNATRGIVKSCDAVARSILAGDDYTTVIATGKPHPNAWRLGANVELILRTDQNRSAYDNLDNLPDC